MSEIMTAAREYASRPADQRFPTLGALVEHAQHEKDLSKEVAYNFRDLRAVPLAGDVALESPKGQAKFSHWSFGQLCRMLGAPASYLRELPAELAANCLNHGLHDAAPSGASASLLVRAANGCPTPTIRACTSESYGRVWDAELYSAVLKGLENDTKWDLPMTWEGTKQGAYRGDRDSFVIVTNGGSIVNDPSARNNMSASGGGSGEMYRGLLVRNSEVGASSIVIERILFRYICGNHILWGAVIDKTFRRRHVGKTVTRDAIRMIARTAYEWAGASAQRDEAIIKLLIDREIAHTRAAVVDELKSFGATKEQAEQAYDLCEQHEGASPRSFWGAMQGMTRASQLTTFQDERFALDSLASQILTRGARLVAA